MKHNYSAIRDNIPEGSVIFYNSRTIIGKFIGTITQSQFSHCGIVCFDEVGDGGKSVLLSESNEKEGATRVVPLSTRFPFALLPSKINFMNKKSKDLCFQIAGTTYAYDYLFWRLLGFSPELSETHKYCSVHVAGILNNCGFSKKDMEIAGRSPGELLRILQMDNRFGDLTWVTKG